MGCSSVVEHLVWTRRRQFDSANLSPLLWGSGCGRLAVSQAPSPLLRRVTFRNSVTCPQRAFCFTAEVVER